MFNRYFEEVARVICKLDQAQLVTITDEIGNTLRAGYQVFVCGNGGSATTASHFVSDVFKNVDLRTRRIFCLSDSTPLVMALANDVSYGDIFVEQLKNLAEPGDAVIGISTSGNSLNVVKALEWAYDKQMTTIGLAGKLDCRVSRYSHYCLQVDSDNTQVLEDAHAIICHSIFKYLWERNQAEKCPTTHPDV